MNKATVTKTLSKVNNCSENYSIGFTRYIYLPLRVQRAMDLAHLLKTGNIDSHAAKVEFLSSLSLEEYKTWLILQ